MKILSVDTAHGSCSVALMIDGTVVTHVHDTQISKQAEMLFSIIEGILSESDIGYKDLDLLSVNTGPGSFTGIRLGVAAIKGISLVTDIPIIAVTSLQAIAGVSIGKDGDILAVLDAKRNQVYCQLFDNSLNELSDPSMLDYHEIQNLNFRGKTYILGNGANLVEKNLLKAGVDITIMDFSFTSNAVLVANLANIKFTSTHLMNNSLSPLYIRSPDAKKSIKS
jgi:tRNA threonylcarbamoyladenosine biosynthesis protein TsaB